MNAAPDAPAIETVILPVTMARQNCAIVRSPGSARAAVIDPGGDVPEILAMLEALDLTLEKIWITHGHPDHAGGAAALKAATGAVIEGPHRGDEPAIARMEDWGRRYGFTHTRAFTPDRWLEHGDRVSLGDVAFEVLHCPGHTPGHLVFFQRDARQAHVGDILFRGSVGKTDHPDGDHRLLVRSITTRLWPLGDDVTFIPGHGPNSTFGQERRINPFVADAVLAAQALGFSEYGED